jgi:hypothetical protein
MGFMQTYIKNCSSPCKIKLFLCIHNYRNCVYTNKNNCTINSIKLITNNFWQRESINTAHLSFDCNCTKLSPGKLKISYTKGGLFTKYGKIIYCLHSSWNQKKSTDHGISLNVRTLHQHFIVIYSIKNIHMGAGLA